MTAPSTTAAVIGMGAVGTVFAAHLKAAGHHVIACVRQAPKNTSISVTGTQELPPAELQWLTPEQIFPTSPDLVVIATKVRHTLQAWERVAEAVTEETVVILAQNGIDHHDRLSTYPSLPLVPALVFFNAQRAEPGVVTVHSGDRVILPDTEEAHCASSFFSGGALSIEMSMTFREEAWRKLLVNLTNPLTALTVQQMGVFANRSMLGLLEEMLIETTQVASAAGVALTRADAQRALQYVLSAPPDVTPSMLQDRLSKRPMEHEGLFGPVQQTAREHHVPTPRLDTVMALLQGIEEAPR